MRIVAVCTGIIGVLGALLWPSFTNAFNNGLELYWLSDSRIYMHVVGAGLALLWAIVWWLPVARRWWHVVLGAQWLSLTAVFTLGLGPGGQGPSWGLALLVAALAALLVTALWMVPSLLAQGRADKRVAGQTIWSRTPVSTS